MIHLTLIGYGYWGPNLLRNFAELPDAAVQCVADVDSKRLPLVRKRYPAVETTTDVRAALADPHTDAVVIATPVSTHFELASEALRAGKHVFIEKPMTATSAEAERLLDLAAQTNRVLMVDHTFVFNGAVRKIHEIVSSGQLGDVHYYDSVRINLGMFQRDVNVLWDLAVHDLSIMDYIFGQRAVRAVSATGISHVSGAPENIAYMTMFLDGGMIAHIHANWLAPVKLRTTLIGGSQKMIVYNDLEPSEKLRIYDKGITLSESGDPGSAYQLRVGYRSGDMWVPQIELVEPLSLAAAHFVACIAGNRTPITDGAMGLRVVRAVEAAVQSMAQFGQLVEVRG